MSDCSVLRNFSDMSTLHTQTSNTQGKKLPVGGGSKAFVVPSDSLCVCICVCVYGGGGKGLEKHVPQKPVCFFYVSKHSAKTNTGQIHADRRVGSSLGCLRHTC